MLSHFRRISASDGIVSVFVYAFVTLFALFSFIPFWLVTINSFASESELGKHGFRLLPGEWSLDAYKYLLTGKQIYYSYGVTLFVTIVGTAAAVIITSMFAYVLAHPKIKYKNQLSFLTYFTILFGTGLVGFYIVITMWLGLKDTIWAMILPSLINPFYTFILVSFFRTLPFEVYESAIVDGAGDYRIFFRIIWPISVPAIATISLFYAIFYWNDWWLALLFVDDYKLQPLQLMIRQLVSNLNILSYIQGSPGSYSGGLPNQGVRLATVCLTIGPIVFLYPYIQKFFVKGLTIGSVKG
ncbi:carbohydrate ABC transporter permease [Cohnella soli]|uniref:Carbohydrate ABC transporter permease n=1 Tax=Cohnella soli TaxID=425005 RepID=A0ABW0I5K3_9BACL